MRNLRPIHHIRASKGCVHQDDRRGINGQRDLDSSALPITHCCFSIDLWLRSQKSLFPRFCLLRPGKGDVKEICKQVPGLLKGKAVFYCTPTVCQALASYVSCLILRETVHVGYHSHFTEEEVQREEDTRAQGQNQDWDAGLQL